MYIFQASNFVCPIKLSTQLPAKKPALKSEDR